MNEESVTYRRALRVTVIGIVALALIAVPVGLLVAGAPGLVAAEIGVAVAALSGLTTQLAMVIGHDREAHVMAGIIGGSWLLKMLIIIVALLLLQNVADFHKELFAAFAVVGVLGTLAVDFWVIRSARIPYVDPGAGSGSK
ncbi:hypothetical protein [Demequina activiva]|uniref:ATP synthase protein I n=1 Tax=Demequina activiva TaxID=1582364 RepID=A0A919Q5L6_9MICO|nr:hypothetical protein [Demequina activiva]GIG55311.1 hypothetical protein Dac01nite_20630 [Demequina activiva]